MLSTFQKINVFKMELVVLNNIKQFPYKIEKDRQNY
jgi:hypothetical protein